LPYTPLQIQLSRYTGPLIMTSANLSGEPIIYDDAKIGSLEHPALAGVLFNLRKIRTGVDDSVVRCLGKEQQMIRRARGYVPMPIWLSQAPPADRPTRKKNLQILACGGMLKNTFCLVKDDFAYLSQHLGDLSSAQAFAEYCSTVDRLGRLLDIEPELVACDLHPDYPTTHYARKLHPEPILVQHHHAHIASVLAEYCLEEEVLGLAFDGTGYGDDGNIWGGEFLICSPAQYQRAGQLAYIPMVGGDSSIAECWKSAAAYLYQAGLEELISHPSWPTLRAALAAGYNCHPSSSAGRLFDAASSLLGICQQARYEGEGAIRLEQAAVTWLRDHGQEIPRLPYEIKRGPERYILDPLPLIRALALGVAEKKDRGFLAAGFHYALSSAAAELCRQICREQGLKTVVLSGGVFQNMLLMQHLVAELRKSGLKVFYNTKVPPNDGGISLGQALIALRRGEANVCGSSS